MDSNRDDAERCLHLAQDALAANNFTKARRLLEKSQRMYPLPELQAALSAKISAASSSTSASSPSSAQPSDDSPQPAPQEEPEPAKEPTTDMTAAVDAVWKVRNKSHYEVLGVAKDADENAIKKAYRRLALKLHPDRNCAPDADEAFKRVSQAFVTLSDSERRKHYDTFGTDDVAQLPRRSASCRSRRTANANFEPFFAMHHDLNADELFEFLFKTAAANNQPNRRRAEPVPEDTESFWERLKPMLLMFFVLLLAIILSKEADSSPFSLHRTAYHTVERATQSDISYFIPENLDLSSARMRRRLDEAVDRTALDDYSGKCAREREHAAYLLAQSRRWLMRESVRRQFRRKYDAFQQPWCARASRLYDRLDRRNHRRM